MTTTTYRLVLHVKDSLFSGLTVVTAFLIVSELFQCAISVSVCLPSPFCFFFHLFPPSLSLTSFLSIPPFPPSIIFPPSLSLLPPSSPSLPPFPPLTEYKCKPLADHHWSDIGHPLCISLHSDRRLSCAAGTGKRQALQLVQHVLTLPSASMSFL